MNCIDDVLIFSRSWKDFILRIELSLPAIDSEGFRIKLVKCIFTIPLVKYLRYIIRENHVLPIQEYLISYFNTA